MIKPAFELAVKLNHSIYDCYYLALAMQENAIVVTADTKFYHRVNESPYTASIQWIEAVPNIEV